MTRDPVPFYYFEFRDADWKRVGNNFKSGAYSEYNFGLYDSNGRPKLGVSASR